MFSPDCTATPRQGALVDQADAALDEVVRGYNAGRSPGELDEVALPAIRQLLDELARGHATPAFAAEAAQIIDLLLPYVYPSEACQ